MPSITSFNDTMQLLQKVLDLRTQNQQVISSNIANAETPGYSPAELRFEEELGKVAGASLKTAITNPGHIPITPSDYGSVAGKIVRTPDKTGIGDENGVSVDQEMVKLSENQILYEAATSMLRKKLAILKYAANDGK